MAEERIKFMVDTQLPPRLSKFIDKRLGFDCIHATKFRQGALLKDAEIRIIAKIEDRIIITKDEDFRNHFLVKSLLEIPSIGCERQYQKPAFTATL